MINPWAVIYFSALVLAGGAGTGAGVAGHVAFVAAVITASASWQLFLAAGGAALGRALTGRRGGSPRRWPPPW